MAEMINYVTSEDNFSSDLVDATLFLRRRLVTTYDTVAATKLLTDALTAEWVPGIAITDWVSHAVALINGPTVQEAKLLVAQDEVQAGAEMSVPMSATECGNIIDLLELTPDVMTDLLGTSEQTFWKWKQEGDVPLAEARLLRIMTRLKFAPRQIVELSNEPIESILVENLDPSHGTSSDLKK